jgi:acyl-CoA reductase-like NAD-dependent aldehyde dehydrogenase
MNRWQDAIQSVAPLPDYMVIDGTRVMSDGRDHIEICDRGSGLSLTEVPAGSADDISAAVAVAKQALNGPWAAISPRERGRLLWAVGERVRENAERLAMIETLESGKPLADARVSIERTADYFCYYAGIVDKLQGETIPLGSGKVCFSELVPIGVTGHIVPWNVPISTAARGLAPALACGNTAVVKPAEDTPLSPILLVELLEEAGVPKGVVNIVPGHGHVAGQALAEHPDVGHVTFTGSVATGKVVMTAAATHLASVTLELGGKSPHLVLPDADLESAAAGVLKNAFKNAGQICSAGTRLLVERSTHAELLERLVTKAESMNLGHGLDNPDMGPLISNRQLQTVVGFVDRARSRGINLVTGGETVAVEDCEGGHFFAPTIADEVPPGDELAQAEIFGPVLSVIPVDDVEHAIEIANATAYGLAAGIYTSDITKAMRFARGVEAGQLFINGYHASGDTVPFGGMKQSGIGREKGLAALANYCEVKAVTVSL